MASPMPSPTRASASSSGMRTGAVGSCCTASGQSVQPVARKIVPTSSERPGLVAADRFLGELTYPLYLLHTMASLIVDALVPAPGTGAYLLALAASLASAVIATATYEAGIGRLRARVRGFSLTGPSLAARVLPAAAPSPIDP